MRAVGRTRCRTHRLSRREGKDAEEDKACERTEGHSSTLPHVRPPAGGRWSVSAAVRAFVRCRRQSRGGGCGTRIRCHTFLAGRWLDPRAMCASHSRGDEFLAVALFVAACASLAGEGRVTGSVTYRERIALSPYAVVQVQLMDVSRVDAPAILLAEQNDRSATPGPDPVRARIRFLEDRPNSPTRGAGANHRGRPPRVHD
jgi:hypothetical protein